MNVILAIKILAAVLLLPPAIFGTVLAQDGDNQAAPRLDFLELVGRTLVTVAPGRTLEETASYIQSDGTGWIAERRGGVTEKPRAMRWFHRSDDKFCVTSPGAAMADAGCSTLSIEKDIATLIEADGSARPGKILPGEAWNLEERATGKEVRSLTGRAAANAVIGNTFIVNTIGGDTQTAVYYLQAGGAGQLLLENQGSNERNVMPASPKPMRWELSDDGEICTILVGVDDDLACDMVSIVGDRATWRSKKGYTLYGRILEGDARNLSTASIASTTRMVDAMAGNTLVVVPPGHGGDETAFYLLPDGSGYTGKRRDNSTDAPTPIQWMVRKDRKLFCVTDVRRAVRDGSFTEDECFGISVRGVAATLTLKSGLAMPGKILKGNARNL